LFHFFKLILSQLLKALLALGNVFRKGFFYRKTFLMDGKIFLKGGTGLGRKNFNNPKILRGRNQNRFPQNIWETGSPKGFPGIYAVWPFPKSGNGRKNLSNGRDFSKAHFFSTRVLKKTRGAALCVETFRPLGFWGFSRRLFRV